MGTGIMKLTNDGRELLYGVCHYFYSSPNTTTMIIKDVMAGNVIHVRKIINKKNI
jgi:hypothetical protein